MQWVSISEEEEFPVLYVHPEDDHELMDRSEVCWTGFTMGDLRRLLEIINTIEPFAKEPGAGFILEIGDNEE